MCSILLARQAPASEGSRDISSLSYMENTNGSTLVHMPKWPLLSSSEGISRTTRKSRWRNRLQMNKHLELPSHEDYEKARITFQNGLPQHISPQKREKTKSLEMAQFCQTELLTVWWVSLFSLSQPPCIHNLPPVSPVEKSKAQQFWTATLGRVESGGCCTADTWRYWLWFLHFKKRVTIF